MDIPDIHSCTRLSAENAALRRKVHQLKHAKEDLEKKLSVLIEKNTVDNLLKSFVTSRDSSVQTEVRPWTARGYSYGLTTKPESKSLPREDLEKTNKIINMHAQLLRRYEKEVKQNITNNEIISELTVRVAELNRLLQEEKEKTMQLERQVMALRRKQSGQTKEEGIGVAEDPLLRDLVQERNKVIKENKRLRQELKGLDKGFFDEVEDLKFALQQSARLNTEYERTLKKLCLQFGVPYPHPEKILDTS